jgi:hypothetical protein
MSGAPTQALGPDWSHATQTPHYAAANLHPWHTRFNLDTSFQYLQQLNHSMASDGKLRIAIIGGGLAGATLMNALLEHSHLSPEIFESAPEFSERGAAVGIAQNGQAALNELGPAIAGSLDRAGAVIMTSSRVRMVSSFAHLIYANIWERIIWGTRLLGNSDWTNGRYRLQARLQAHLSSTSLDNKEAKWSTGKRY